MATLDPSEVTQIPATKWDVLATWRTWTVARRKGSSLDGQP